MPGTARLFGIDSTSTPADQIDAGIRYLRRLDAALPQDIDFYTVTVPTGKQLFGVPLVEIETLGLEIAPLRRRRLFSFIS